MDREIKNLKFKINNSKHLSSGFTSLPHSSYRVAILRFLMKTQVKGGDEK